MTRRYTGAEARELAAKATPDWIPDVSPGGMMCLTAWVPDASEPEGKSHVVLATFTHTTDIEDLALASAAPDLAESLAAVEVERDALRAERDEARGILFAEGSSSRQPCCDNSCVLREGGPHGMSTNGGCRCPAGLLRMRYRGMRQERDALREHYEAAMSYEAASESLYALNLTRSPEADIAPMREAARVAQARLNAALAALREAAK